MVSEESCVSPQQKYFRNLPHSGKVMVITFLGNISESIYMTVWLSSSIPQLFVKSKDPVFSKLFEAPEVASTGRGRKKGGSFQTVAMIHKQAVEHLLTTLQSTTPHFIRCVSLCGHVTCYKPDYLFLYMGMSRVTNLAICFLIWTCHVLQIWLSV